jgi:hypothetical protein
MHIHDQHCWLDHQHNPAWQGCQHNPSCTADPTRRRFETQPGWYMDLDVCDTHLAEMTRIVEATAVTDLTSAATTEGR